MGVATASNASPDVMATNIKKMTPYVNTAYIMRAGASYTIDIGRPTTCVCIYVPYINHTSYRGFAMALRNGAKYQSSDQRPNNQTAANISDWPVTFSETGVTFTAPTCIVYNSIACEVCVS